MLSSFARRASLGLLVLTSCAYDYDGAFGPPTTTGEAGQDATSAGGDSTGSGGTTDVTGGGGAMQAGGSAGADPSTSSGTPCVCAFPGTCDGNNVCICPDSVSVERYPGIGEGTNGGNQGWSDVTAITAPDGSAAFVNLGNGQVSEQMTARAYDFSSIPDDATITGIHVDIDRCRTVNQGPVDVHDSYLTLASGGAAIGAEANHQTWGACGGAGGAYDFATSGIGPAQVKNDIAVHMRIRNESGSATGFVNFVRMTVTYHPTCAP